MFRSYEAGWKRYRPTLRLTCAIISFCIFLGEFLLAFYEYMQSRDGNLLATILTGIFAGHGILSFLYFMGIIKQKEQLLLPFLTIQLISMTSLGLLVITWWIGTLLSSFDLVTYKSPIVGLTTTEFFVITGIFLLLLFIASCKVSMILYKGYKRVERDNQYRKQLGQKVVRSMSRSNTIPPTIV